MNIDKNKVIKLLNTNNFNGLSLAEIESCEIKPVKCGRCVSHMCHACCHNEFGDHFKPKPEKKIIDLSMMVGSDVDCEFQCSTSDWVAGKLLATHTTFNYKMKDGTNWDKCRIRQDHWHSWQGGECPLPEGLKIKIICRDGKEYPLPEGYTETIGTWKHKYDNQDIIVFKVLGTAEGWKYRGRKMNE